MGNEYEDHKTGFEKNPAMGYIWAWLRIPIAILLVTFLLRGL